MKISELEQILAEREAFIAKYKSEKQAKEEAFWEKCAITLIIASSALIGLWLVALAHHFAII